MCWPWTTPAGSGTGVSDSAAGFPPTDVLLAALSGIPSRVEIAMPGGSVYCNHGDAPRPADLIITRSVPLPRGATLTVWEKNSRIALDDLPVLAWIATPAPGGSWIFRVNSAWAAFTGVPSDLWQTAVHPEDGESAGVAFTCGLFDALRVFFPAVRAIGAWEHAISTGTVYETENRVRRADGLWFWFLNRAVPLRDDSGGIVGYIGTQCVARLQGPGAARTHGYTRPRGVPGRVNIDALKVAEARLVEERARLGAVLDQLPVSVVLAAAPPSGEVLLWNRQTSAVWRRPPGHFAGQPVSVLDGSYYAGVTG